MKNIDSILLKVTSFNSIVLPEMANRVMKTAASPTWINNPLDVPSDDVLKIFPKIFEFKPMTNVVGSWMENDFMIP